MRRTLLAGNLLFRCCHCDIELNQTEVTLDHIIPKANGGRTVLGNIALACFKCNNERGTTDFDEFRLRKAIEVGFTEPLPLRTPRWATRLYRPPPPRAPRPRSKTKTGIGDVCDDNDSERYSG